MANLLKCYGFSMWLKGIVRYYDSANSKDKTLYQLFYNYIFYFFIIFSADIIFFSRKTDCMILIYCHTFSTFHVRNGLKCSKNKSLAIFDPQLSIFHVDRTGHIKFIVLCKKVFSLTISVWNFKNNWAHERQFLFFSQHDN